MKILHNIEIYFNIYYLSSKQGYKKTSVSFQYYFF